MGVYPRASRGRIILLINFRDAYPLRLYGTVLYYEKLDHRRLLTIPCGVSVCQLL